MTISLTGSLLVFKADYVRAVIPEARMDVDLSVTALAEVTEKAETTFGASELRALVYATSDFGLHKAYLTEGQSAYLDGSGAVVEQWDQNGRFEDWLFDLHHRLLAGQTGLLIVGFTGLASLILIITGLIAIWPMRRGIRRGLRITNWSRNQILSVHRNLGFYTAVPILLAIVTGVALTFPSESRSLFDRLGGPKPLNIKPFQPGKVDWEKALSAADAAFNDAVPRMALWDEDGKPASLRLKQPQEWHPNGRTVFLVNPATSNVIGLDDALAQGFGREAFNAMYPIHAAYIGGRIYDLFIFITGLVLTSLGGLGLFAFIGQTKR